MLTHTTNNQHVQLSAMFGTWFYMQTHLPSFISTMALFGLTFMLMQPFSTPQEAFPKLLIFGFFQGASVGSLVELALAVNPEIVLWAFVATTTIFACFALGATLSKRRSFFYLSSLLASAMSWLLMATVLNWFLKSEGLFNVELWGGLVVFIGYVVFDTQLIIEKASSGDRNYVRHAFDLFLDLAAIFVRVLVILLKREGTSREEENRKKKNRR